MGGNLVKKVKLKKVVKTSKVVSVSEQDIKKHQREQYSKKRKANQKSIKDSFQNFKFTAKHVAIIAVILVGLCAYYALNNYHRLGLVFNRNINSDDANTIDMMYTDNIVVDYEDKVLVFQKGVLTTYASNGSKVWSKELDEIYTPSIYTAGKYIQVTNFDTGYIYVLDGQYEVARIKIEGEILSSKINSDGTSVVEYSTSGLKTVLGVYSKKGKELYALKLTSNTLSDYILSENSKVLAYSYADISGISLVTKVDVIELDKVGTEGYTFDTIISKNNELVYKMYWDGKYLNILLNDSVVKYNYSSKKIEDSTISDLNAIDMDICDNTLAYVTQNSNTSEYLLNIVDYDLSLKSSVQIEEPPKYYIYSDGLIYVCYQKQMDIYNKFGVKIKSYESDTVITRPVIYNDGKCIAMYISNKIVTFKV